MDGPGGIGSYSRRSQREEGSIYTLNLMLRVTNDLFYR